MKKSPLNKTTPENLKLLRTKKEKSSAQEGAIPRGQLASRDRPLRERGPGLVRPEPPVRQLKEGAQECSLVRITFAGHE